MKLNILWRRQGKMKGKILNVNLTDVSGRTFYTTDVHGRFDLLEEHLNRVQYDPSIDKLIIGGDTIDRGKLSGKVLDYICNNHTLVISGNHELMFLDAWAEDFRPCYASDMFMQNGGYWVLDLPQAELDAIASMFKTLPLAIKLTLKSGKNVGIIHAGVPYDDWDRFEQELNSDNKDEVEHVSAYAVWNRGTYRNAIRMCSAGYHDSTTTIENIDYVLVGHNITESNEIEVYSNIHYCDRGAIFGNLAFFDVEEYFKEYK